MVQSVRFYEQKYPNVGDVVIVRVESIQDMGAYVRLLEYNNIEGMIPHSELSRRRIRSIQKLIRVGRNEAVVVLRVDENKGYIDLSKRRANPSDLIQAEERYLKAKLVNQIVRNVADVASCDAEKLYEETAWKLQKTYGDMYNAFKLATVKPQLFDECNINESVKNILITKIIHHLKSHPQKIRADIEVTCYNYEGVDSIKAALKAGMAVSSEDISISVDHFDLSTHILCYHFVF
ncbi:eukaryotic translation initiation factor 2 subunit 1-like isoform X2 [Zophobas morio]|uniref:eukaryotic translation initiation factor 2 subunit 1-like isoform X2 n=1 Tax=Zophobas morio TaxID=2755281 RepID=UPI0030831A3D